MTEDTTPATMDLRYLKSGVGVVCAGGFVARTHHTHELLRRYDFRSNGLGDAMEEAFSACIVLGRRYGFEEEHCRQDARLAVRLFDLTADLHGLDDRCRDLLYCAGLLHDIGYVEGYWGHHKTAYKLILKADLPGLTERERQVVANVARYHRGARPKLSHQGFAVLSPEDRELVTMLGAILRLADGLDRTHTDAVRGVDLELASDRLVLLVDCPQGCDAEVWAGEKKGRLLGELFGLQVKVQERMQR